MSTSNPIVSILITTFNRSSLLKRAIESVLKQDYEDFELIVIDDCSTDDTQKVMQSYRKNPIIRYVRNEENVGKLKGDRAHIKRFIYELAKGKYFGYLCDDDYWLPSNLLSQQIAIFQRNSNTTFVMGGQFSYFLTGKEELPPINRDTIHKYLDNVDVPIHPKVAFVKNAFPQSKMTSSEFLTFFSEKPTERNIVIGATLYSKEKFMLSRALTSAKGSQWQAGYELLMGPGAFGDVYYINKPCVISEIRDTNASFRRTQVEHYLDSVLSIELSLRTPFKLSKSSRHTKFLKFVKDSAITNLSRAYYQNTLTIRETGRLSLCSSENISKPVCTRHALWVYCKNCIKWDSKDLDFWIAITLSPKVVPKLKFNYYRQIYENRILPAFKFDFKNRVKRLCVKIYVTMFK